MIWLMIGLLKLETFNNRSRWSHITMKSKPKLSKWLLHGHFFLLQHEWKYVLFEFLDNSPISKVLSFVASNHIKDMRILPLLTSFPCRSNHWMSSPFSFIDVSCPVTAPRKSCLPEVWGSKIFEIILVENKFRNFVFYFKILVAKDSHCCKKSFFHSKLIRFFLENWLLRIILEKTRLKRL